MHLRTTAYRRNERLESLLNELSAVIGPAELRAIDLGRSVQWPVVFVVGAPRSGTTLLLQWLANLGRFCYPTNWLSRFYAAPYVGALLQRMLVEADLQFRDEFGDLVASTVGYDSDLGKTAGLLGPNEFWYFWRRFFHWGETIWLDEAALRKADGRTFAAELAAIERVFERPLAMKALIMDCNLPYLDSLVEKAVFMHVRRNPVDNAHSLLEARRRFSGDIREWYSFCPREYSWLKDRDPYTQVAGQVYFLSAAIEEARRSIDPGRWLAVDYERFCTAPERVHAALRERCAAQGCDLGATYEGPGAFPRRSDARRTEEAKQIERAYRRIVDEVAGRE